jgi:hypothetical protein
VLVVAAVVVGVLLLHVGQSPSGTTGSTPTTTSTTTKAGHASTTTTTTPASAVKVLVANGSTTTGAATFFANELKSDGWSTLTPVTATTHVSASSVYFAAGQEAAAKKVATQLGLKVGVVQALSSSVPVSGATAADVVVVVGPDLGTQATSSSTTTTAATSSAGSST